MNNTYRKSETDFLSLLYARLVYLSGFFTGPRRNYGLWCNLEASDHVSVRIAGNRYFKDKFEFRGTEVDKC